MKKPTRFIPISPQQQEFITSKAWLTGFTGGRGAGKTAAGVLCCLWNARGGDNIMAVSPTFAIATETTFKTFVDFGAQTNAIIKTREHPYPMVRFKTVDGGEAQIGFKSADNPDSLVGRNVSILWFDEASLTAQEAFERGLGCARYKGAMGKIYATFTPRGLRHWTFERFYFPIQDLDLYAGPHEELVYFNDRPYEKRDNTKLVHCPSSKNPFLASEFAGLISQNYSARLQLQELVGMFLEVEGLMFSRSKFNFVDHVPVDCERVRYIDKAATVGEDACYSAMVLLAKHRNGTFFVEDVVRGQWKPYERNKILGEVFDKDYRKYQGTVINYIEQEGGSAGKEVNDDLIRAFSKYPIYTDSAVASAIRNVGGITLPGDAKIRRAYPFSAQVEAGNVVLKRDNWNSDYLDELCVREDTLILMHGNDMWVDIPISQIVPGDIVKTREGGKKVVKCQPTGRQGIWVLCTGARELFATCNHPIYSCDQNKFVPLKNLKLAEKILVYDSSRRFREESVTVLAYTFQSKEVWNLEVEDQHEYLANGILVHNCMFPEFKYSDQVDASSGAFNKLSANSTGDIGGPSRYIQDQWGNKREERIPLPPSLVEREYDEAHGLRDYRSSKLPWL